MKLVGLNAEALDRLQSLEHDGRLRPDDVVADAADPGSPLHGYFEWDDAAAAERHRLHQARGLIQAVRVVWTTETLVLTSTLYVRDPDADRNEQGYIAVPRLADDRELALRMVYREVERIEAAIDRARGPAAICGLADVLESMLSDLLHVREMLAAA